MSDPLAEKAQSYLATLCGFKPGRRTGSAGNRAATDFFARTIGRWGWAIDAEPFSCLDYRAGQVLLEKAGRSFPVRISPYSLPCDVTAELLAVSSIAELERGECAGKILLLRGEISSEPLMPKNFPFYNPEDHKKIYALLEAKRPAAIVAATKKNPAASGALDPPPLFNDGDFDIPSVFCREETGGAIAGAAGKLFRLLIEAERIPASARNVIGRKKPDAREKIVVCAHIDAYEDCPGAADNASGTAVLLLLAELLEDWAGEVTIELAALNGEDHYSAAGQVEYLRRSGSGITNTRLAVNLDGVGYREGRTAYSLYDCPGRIRKKAERCFREDPDLTEGPRWFQGDHMIFVGRGIPALAFTTDRVEELTAEITHTHRDTPDRIDPIKLAGTASALRSFLAGL